MEVTVQYLVAGSTETDRTYLGAGRGEGLGRGRVDGPPVPVVAVCRCCCWEREGEPLARSELTGAVGAGLFIGEARGRVTDDERTPAACCL